MPGPPHPPPLRSSPRAPHEPGRRPGLLKGSSPGEGENLKNLSSIRVGAKTTAGRRTEGEEWGRDGHLV